MKKRGVILIGGVILLCLLLGVYFLMKNRNSQQTEETIQQEEKKISLISLENVSRISFMIEGEITGWTKQEDIWSLDKDGDFPTDTEKIDSIISTLSAMTEERTLENIKNLKGYGLEEPVNLIEIQNEEGQSERISVGNKNPSTGDTYLYLNDEKTTVYTVENDINSLLEGSLFDYAVGEEMPSIVSSTIKKIEVKKKENSYILESDGNSSTGWSVFDQNGSRKTADSSAAGNLQSAAAGLSFRTYYSYNCVDRSTYGLDNPRMVVTVDYTETETKKSNIDTNTGVTEGDSDGAEDADKEKTTSEVSRTMILYVGNLADDGYYYVRLGNSQEVHGISQSSIDIFLNGKAFDYWNLAVDYLAIADLDYMNITYENQRYQLKRVVEESEEDEEGTIETTYYVNDKEVDGDLFLQFYRGAAAMTCQSRLEKYSSAGEEPELVLEYKGTGRENVTVTYIPRDASFYTVVDQDGNSGLVNKMNVKELIEKLVNLLNDYSENDNK